jgi:hypothetical protein
MGMRPRRNQKSRQNGGLAEHIGVFGREVNGNVGRSGVGRSANLSASWGKPNFLIRVA